LSKLKFVDKYTTIFARENGIHYHLAQNCPTLNNVFEAMHYIKISFVEMRKRNLKPCVHCGYD
jgi:hypothetical protein